MSASIEEQVRALFDAPAAEAVYAGRLWMGVQGARVLAECLAAAEPKELQLQHNNLTAGGKSSSHLLGCEARRSGANQAFSSTFRD